VRWLRLGLFCAGVIALLSGIVLLEFEWVPASAIGWTMLPLGGAALLLVEAGVELFLAKTRKVLTIQAAVLLAVTVALLAIGLAVAWKYFA
jgi:hypothetical protein